ncbi:MAG: hypothetical protein M0Z67_04265 [Nitrospiraceae bacterium]|nr:hypothetical protein [Nitrospiraceae bacterium]
MRDGRYRNVLTCQQDDLEDYYRVSAEEWREMRDSYIRLLAETDKELDDLDFDVIRRYNTAIADAISEGR